jgi:hypothetical protein
MSISYRICVSVCCALSSLVVLGGEPTPIVKFSANELTLEQALKELQKETGNIVLDRRTNTSNPKVKLPAKPDAFWPTLDAICKEAKSGYNVYQGALVDAPYRQRKTHYSGPFRFTFKQIDATRYEDEQEHLCRVTLEVAWEPRFQALYVNLDRATAAFDNGTASVDADAAFYVARTRATDKIILKMKAPPRKTEKIDSIKGSIRVIGSPKLLDFAVSAIEGKAVTQEDVTVTLMRVDKKAARWTVTVRLAYPDGAVVPLESFQNWRGNNRVWLAWKDRQTNKTVELEPSSTGGAQEADNVTTIPFHFTPRGDTPLPPEKADVTLHYLTPNRVASFTVPFEFRDLPLP